MTESKIALKTFPDLVDQHKDLPVDYFEVAIRPTIFGKKTSLESQCEAYKPIADKVIGIHGAIYREGVNLLDPDSLKTNKEAFDYTQKAANFFPNIDYILFHPGHIIPNTRCSFETIQQFISKNRFDKLSIEFEPFFAYNQRYIFPIHSIDDWVRFQQSINTPIILDTAHCFITAQALGYPFYDYFNTLVEVLKPKIIHLSNTDLSDGGKNDKHLPFKEGVIDFEKLAHCLQNKTLVIEVNNVSIEDINYVKSLVKTTTSIL